MLKRTGEEADMLPLLLQKSFSRPSWTVVQESDLHVLCIGPFISHKIGNDSLEVVSIFENPETWPV